MEGASKNSGVLGSVAAASVSAESNNSTSGLRIKRIHLKLQKFELVYAQFDSVLPDGLSDSGTHPVDLTGLSDTNSVDPTECHQH